jgi:hypothetical protein
MSDAEDLVAAFTQAKSHGNEQAQIVYRKRLAALGLSEKGKPLHPEQPAAAAPPASPPEQDKSGAAAKRAQAAEHDEGAQRRAPAGRQTPRGKQSST